MKWCAGLLASFFFAGLLHAGPFAPGADDAGTTAIRKDSPSIAGWATGYLNYVPGPNVIPTWQTPNLALGPAVGDSFDIVSLGDKGSITLTFNGSIFNGPGADFAVFENGFSDNFLELAWVEVSSNGTNFFRFPGFSYTANPVTQFGTMDPTNIDGFAGKYRQGFGTPFDLGLLIAGGPIPGLDVNNVRYVRILDILGNGSEFDSFPNIPNVIQPHPIYDPTPTVESGGFDLDAVAVMHLTALAPVTPVPEPSEFFLMGIGLLLLGIMRRRVSISAWISRHGRMVLAAAALAAVTTGAQAAIATFDDLPLAPESFYSPGVTTTFTSGPATFAHNFQDFGFGCCWDGWTYSNMTDKTTPGFSNQSSAYTGGGLASANYGVAFIGFIDPPTITFTTPSLVSSASFTNTTYAALSMLNGDPFAKKFGGATGNDEDFFKLTIIGRDAAHVMTGSVDFFLADYRFSNNAQDYILSTWKPISLASLGLVTSLEFGLTSSDSGSFGMNTPAYFAMDSLSVTAVPEPRCTILLACGLALIVFFKVRRRSGRAMLYG